MCNSTGRSADVNWTNVPPVHDGWLPASDVCLETEASPRGSKSAISASPRRFDASPRLGLNSMTSKLRYDIIIRNFHQFIFRLYVFKSCKTKLHLCIKQRFRYKLNVFSMYVS